MRYLSTVPRPGDTDQNLADKILQELGAVAQSGDALTKTLRRILTQLGGSPSGADDRVNVLRKIVLAYGGSYAPDDGEVLLLRNIVTMVTHVVPDGDSETNELYTKWLKGIISGGMPVPNAPNALSADNVGQLQFRANWDAVPDATSYRIDVSTVSNFASFVEQNLNVGNVTNHTFVGNYFGVTRYYRVRAVNAAGVSLNSNVITVVTSPQADDTIVLWDDLNVDGGNPATIVTSPVGNLDYSAQGWLKVRALNAPALVSLTFSDNGSLQFLEMEGLNLFNGLTLGLSGVSNLDLTGIGTDVGAINLFGNPLISVDFSGITNASTINLSDNVLASLTFPDLASVTNDFIIASHSSLASISAPVLATVPGNFSVSGSAALTTLNLPGLTSAGNMTFDNVPVLTSVDLTALVSTTGFVLISNAAGTVNWFSALETIGQNLEIAGSGFTSVVFASLATVATGVSIHDANDLVTVDLAQMTAVDALSVTLCPALTTLTFTAATQFIDSITLSGLASLTTFSTPAVDTILSNGGDLFTINDCASLVTLNFPSLANTIQGYVVSDNSPALTTINFNGRAFGNNGNSWQIVNANLSQATVDAFLQAAVDGSWTGGVMDLSGGTSSAPSGAGDANKAILQGNSVVVITN